MFTWKKGTVSGLVIDVRRGWATVITVNSPHRTPGPSSPHSLSRRLFLGGSVSALTAGVITPAFLRKTSAPAGLPAARASLAAEIAPAAAT
jgi:hypothetical protein